MAYVKNKLVTDADNDYLNKKSEVDNYGDFATSSSTNAYKQDMDETYDALKNYGEFNASDKLVADEMKWQDTENAVSNYGDFTYGKQGMYDDVMNKILNREQFTYDVNGDALYQQYKDQYITGGKMAMMDTMGQAAAMTGGYGNSYAQGVGQQAYQGYLQQLNDKVPELYKLALDKYNSEGNELYNQYSMLSSDRSTQYGEWNDAYNKLVADRDYYGNKYNTNYNREYGEWTDQFNMLGTVYDAATNAYNTGWNQDYTTWEGKLNQLSDLRDSAFDYALNLYNQDYGQYRDTVSDEQWNKQYAETQKANQLNAQKFEYEKQQSNLAAQVAELQGKYVVDNKALRTATNNILSEEEFKKKYKITGFDLEKDGKFGIHPKGFSDGKTTYTNYKDYVKKYLATAYEAGDFNEATLNALLDQFGID